MSYQATKNMFQLMKLLSRDRSYSIIEIEDLLEIDERTFHRYQNAMAEIGFKLKGNS
jgi:predicted DNA-binding transcriptional regulator YafY